MASKKKDVIKYPPYSNNIHFRIVNYLLASTTYKERCQASREIKISEYLLVMFQVCVQGLCLL